jgi:hypothetical protein
MDNEVRVRLTTAKVHYYASGARGEPQIDEKPRALLLLRLLKKYSVYSLFIVVFRGRAKDRVYRDRTADSVMFVLMVIFFTVILYPSLKRVTGLHRHGPSFSLESNFFHYDIGTHYQAHIHMWLRAYTVPIMTVSLRMHNK